MGQAAESRGVVRHFLNIRRPYDYINPDFRLICQGVSELTETFEAQTNDVQYICETTSTTNITGYKVSFPLSMGYIKNDPVELWIDNVIKTLPTGANTACDYVRINTAEEMFGVKNAYIGVRRRGTVQAGSIGGSSTDSMTSEITINGAGDGVIGYITVDNIVPEKPVFTWTNADLETPIITSPISDSTVPGTNVLVEGTGTNLNYVVVIYGIGTNDKTAAVPVGPSGTWSVTIPAVNLGKNARIAAIQYENSSGTGKQSVSSTPVSFTTEAPTINPPVITEPENGATGVALNATISGTGLTNATVTVNYGGGTLGQAIVDGDGNFEVTPTVALTASTQYTINATQQIGGSSSIPSTSVAFTTASS
jgi:hypothetical protein